MVARSASRPGEGRRRRPAETGVDLVEEQGHGASGARRPEHRPDGEVDSRQLTPRGDASHGSRFFAGIGGDEQLTLLDPVGIEGDAAAIPHQGAVIVNPRLPTELQMRSSHAEPGEHFFNRSRQSNSGFSPSLVESPGGGVKVPEGGGSSSSGGLESVFDLFKLVLFRDQRRPVFEDTTEGLAVLEHELVEAVEPALDPIEDAGTVVHISGQGPNLADHLLDVDPCFGQDGGALGQRQTVRHHFFQVALGASDAIDHRSVIVAEAPENRSRQLLQSRRVAQDLPPGGQLLVFALGGIDRSDLGELEGRWCRGGHDGSPAPPPEQDR